MAALVVKVAEDFSESLKESGHFPLKADRIDILQINVSRKCNLCCQHCHVEAGPSRSEVMARETLAKCLEILKTNQTIATVDITGGSPEMNPHLGWFVKEVAKLNRRVLARTNLVILLDPKFSKFIDVYVENKVEIVASLPCYLEENVDQQRGEKSFKKSIQVLRLLNQKGYGRKGSGLILNLVYNPVGAQLPPQQAELEQDYKIQLKENHDIEFNNLFCLTNMPLGRYLSDLKRAGQYEGYMAELVKAFNPEAVPNVMCRTTISVGWDGQLYDCDFNQAMGLPIGNISKFDVAKLSEREIIVQDYCYGCTAGAGSSCQGALE